VKKNNRFSKILKDEKKVLFFFLFFLVSPNIFSITDHPSKTIWDSIMKEQSFLNLHKGIEYMSSSLYSKASIEFLKAIEKDPNSMAYTLYGASLYWMGDNENAILNYNKAIEIDSKNDVAWQLKGISLARNGDLKGALDCFNTAADINPSRSDVMMNIGSVYFSLNNITNAIDHVKKAIKLDGKNPLYYYQLGLIYFAIEDLENSIDNFKKAYSLKPDYEEAIVWLAISYEKNQEKEKAINLYKKAISIKPYDFFARYKLSRLVNKEKINKIIMPCFELKPDNNSSSIGLEISYSANSFKSDNTESNPVLKPLRGALKSLKQDEEAIVSIDIIEMSGINIYEKKQGELTKKLSEKFKPITYRIISKNYTVEGRDKDGIEKMIKDIEKNIDDKKDYRINFNIQTRKIKNENQDKDALQYIPRDIGNDMGLWIISNPWINIIEEDMDEKPSKIPEINALGLLLLGEIELSEKEFEKVIETNKEISYLGLGVIDYLKDREDEAINKFSEVIKINPDNQIAKKNLRWLNGDK